MTEAEIKAKYKALHDTLSDSYYAGTSGLTKEEFDHQHGKVWSDMEAELIAEGYHSPPEPPLAFIPKNPSLGVEHRLSHVEAFLNSLYPPST